MNKINYILFAILFLSSCFKEEDPRSSVTNFETIELGDEYKNQIFYSLYDTSIVSTNDYQDWSFAFYSGNDASYIRLNAAANMWAVKTNNSDFNANYSDLYNESDKRFDGPNGYQEYLAIDVSLGSISVSDTVFCEKMVYLIHPGIAANGLELGQHKKFMFEGVYQDSYIIRYANLDGSDYHRVLVPKDAYLNYTSYSINTHQVVMVEPDKQSWDLLFSRFTDTVYTTDGSEFLQGYAVTGAYLNENGVEAYLEEDIAYEDIALSNIDFNRLSKNINVIGHNWKQFIDQYYIFKNKTYIIKDRGGRYFKLRFLSFYDAETGLKGSPSFEFELL